MKITYEGWDSIDFDPSVSQIVKYGLLDTYDLSSNPSEWIVLDAYVFWSHRIQRGVVVPRWFVTDLASIPKIFRPLISVNERHRYASLPHDVLYSLAGQVGIDKKTSDLIFLDFLNVCKVPYWKKWSMYLAVKFGGRLAWEGENLFYASVFHIEAYAKRHPMLNLYDDIDIEENPENLIIKGH